MANTYTLIEAKTITSAVGSITFTSIPQTYTDLKMSISARSSLGAITDTLQLRFNSNSSNYSNKNIEGDGSGVYSYNWGSAPTYGAIGDGVGDSSTSNTFSNGDLYIPNYTSANYKSFSADSVGENNATTARASFSATLWSDTSAITSITVNFKDGGNLMQYSTFYLYGISNS
jgi:hypothetical protein